MFNTINIHCLPSVDDEDGIFIPLDSVSTSNECHYPYRHLDMRHYQEEVDNKDVFVEYEKDNEHYCVFLQDRHGGFRHGEDYYCVLDSHLKEKTLLFKNTTNRKDINIIFHSKHNTTTIA